MTLELATEEQTSALGAALASSLGPADASPSDGVQLHLCGPLGAGKTTVVRGLLRAMGVEGVVRSPTYTLMESYDCAGWRVVHYDLYRLEPGGDGGEALELLDARDQLAAGILCCVEWPERAGSWLPPADVTLTLAHRNAHRDAHLIAQGSWGARWLERLQSSQKC